MPRRGYPGLGAPGPGGGVPLGVAPPPPPHPRRRHGLHRNVLYTTQHTHLCMVLLCGACSCPVPPPPPLGPGALSLCTAVLFATRTILPSRCPLRPAASDKCLQEKRKTINGDDLLWAMATLGFDHYVAPLQLYLAKYREVGAGPVCARLQGMVARVSPPLLPAPPPPPIRGKALGSQELIVVVVVVVVVCVCGGGGVCACPGHRV